nr:hypothetical protein [Tabrizicola piscis]
MIHGLRARGLVRQKRLYLLHLAAVEFAEVWVNLEAGCRVDLLQAAFEIALAGFKLRELLADDPRITIAVEDERQGALDAAVDLVEVLAVHVGILVPAPTHALDFHPKARGKLSDQVVTPEENVLQSCQDAGLKLCSADADRAGAGAPFTAR